MGRHKRRGDRLVKSLVMVQGLVDEEDISRKGIGDFLEILAYFRHSQRMASGKMAPMCLPLWPFFPQTYL